MIVKQLIEKLEALKTPDAEVYIHDGVSGHYLPAAFGKLTMDNRYPPPQDDSVILHGRQNW